MACVLSRTLDVFLILVLALLRIILNSQAFNLDLRTAIVHQNTHNSSFGFSVAMHLERNHSWLLVGAPAAQTSQPGVEKGGAVYRCSIDTPNACYEVPFDRSGSKMGSNNGVLERMDNKSHQWFGATLHSSGPNGIVVACAPLYVYFSANFKRREPVGSCFVSRNYFTTFHEYAPCRTSEWGYHRQGSCQAGFSTAFSEDGRRLFIGAVGSWYWQGQVFSQDMLVRSDNLSTTEQPAHYDDSYLGYSMASGEFSGDTIADIAVGVPRGNNLTGKVIVFNSTLSPIYEIGGEQIGSYFGYSMCVVDMNGDRLHDVVISAPMYSDFSAKDGSYETGRVYVVYQGKTMSKKFSKWHILSGESTRGRFGLSLATLRDLNKDGFEDIAVGAPYGGPQQSGVVYVFHGSRDGVLKKPSQVIYATDVQSDLKTFGFSLAGGLDIDVNEYSDLLVGAYEVDRVVLFKSRPVVSVVANLNIEPERINLDKKECSLLDTSEVSCVTVLTCLEYTGLNVPNKLEFEIETVLDSTMDQGPRLFFLSNEHMNKLNVTVEPSKEIAVCEKVYVYIKTDIRDKLTPITVEVNYALKDRKPKGKTIKPILNQYVGTKLVKQFNILRNCGRDNICYPDLAVTAVRDNSTYVMGTGDKLLLNVSAFNNGEDAFEAALYVELPPGVDYINVNHSDELLFIFSCSWLKDYNNTLKCELGNPFAANSSLNFTLILAPVYFNSSEDNYEFFFEVNSTNAERNETIPNNLFVMRVPVKVEVEILVSGIPFHDSVSYNKSIIPTSHKEKESDIGPEVIHIYQFQNDGPSDVVEADVVILWPTYTLSRDHLLYLLEQPDVRGNGRCELVPNANPVNVTLEHTTLSPNDGLATSAKPEITYDVDSAVDVNATHDVRSRLREPRSTETEFQKELSCGPTLCTQIHCQVYNLAKGQSVFFTVRSRVWTETLIKYGVENVTISSKIVARVTKLPYSVQPDYLDHKTFVVTTLVNPADGDIFHRFIPWWIIAAAVCTGVLLLALLVLLLWKLGFFKRKRPQDEFEREPLNKPEKNGMLEIGDEAL